MIDTHSHIIPAIDDGAQNLSESVKFVEIAAKQGVEIMFATPHSCDGVFYNTKQDILLACSDLTAFLKEKGIFIKILPGAEIRVNHDLIMEYDKGTLLTLNNAGTHLLIELPSMFITNAVSMMIRQLCDRGVTPIIAHAERNPMIMNKPGLASEFIYNGALIQITAGSLTGEFGKFAMQTAQTLVTMDQVFCLGSDIHPGRRYGMAKAKKKLIKMIGRSEADLITMENPFSILKQTNINQKQIYMKKSVLN